MHVETRRVFITPSTFNPHEAWMVDQATAFLKQLPKDHREKFYLQHDRDTKFTKSFDETLEAANANILRSPYRSPNLTAFVERFHQTLLVEALDYFIIFGCKHMDYIVREFVTFYLNKRPHQSLTTARSASGRASEKCQLPTSSPSRTCAAKSNLAES